MKSSFIFRYFLLFFFFFNGTFAATSKLWSITEMAEMAGYGERKLSSVVITGSLQCKTPVSGATVAIKCHTGSRMRSKWIKAVTDDFGEFVIHLPSHLHAIPHLEKACFIKPLHVHNHHYYKRHKTFSKSNIHKGIKLVSSRNGFRVYTSGKIMLHGCSSRSSSQAYKADM